jgi:hypothetical protein
MNDSSLGSRTTQTINFILEQVEHDARSVEVSISNLEDSLTRLEQSTKDTNVKTAKVGLGHPSGFQVPDFLQKRLLMQTNFGYDERNPDTEKFDYDYKDHKADHYPGWVVGNFITQLNLNFFEGNIVKYVCRHRNKDGKKDLIKARDYLDQLIKEYK